LAGKTERVDLDVPADVARAMESYLLGGAPGLTRIEVAQRAGVPLELAVTLWHQLGFPHHADDDVAFA
jgi:adenylate cyclase